MIRIKIGTRNSKLAKIQTNRVIESLIASNPELTMDNFQVIEIVTTGDKIKDKSLAQIGGKSLFTKEIEEALYNNNIDIAMHSMKDVTASIPKGLLFACYLKRDDPRDALVSLNYKNIKDLPIGSTVGTSSSRRKALLLNKRPDLNIILFRGNIDTRLTKLMNGKVDAAILATAALERMNISKDIYNSIDTSIMLPSVTQGIIGVQCREDDKNIIKYLTNANNKDSEIMVNAERAVLEAIGGDCSTPLAAYCEIKNHSIKLTSLLASRDGKTVFKVESEGKAKDAREIGYQAGKKILKNLDINLI